MTVRPLAEGPEVVTLGEAMAVFSAEPGVPLAMATTFRRAVAGAEFNVAVGLARLGHRVAWIGRVGADALGRAVLAALRADGLDVSGVRVDDRAPTGVLIRDVHAARRIEVAYHRSGSADVDPVVVAAARLLHVTGITPLLSPSCHAAVVSAMAAAREAGVTVCLDPNLRLRLASAAEARRVLVPLLASTTSCWPASRRSRC